MVFFCVARFNIAQEMNYKEFMIHESNIVLRETNYILDASMR